MWWWCGGGRRVVLVAQTNDRPGQWVETEIIMASSNVAAQEQEEEARVPGAGLKGHYPELFTDHFASSDLCSIAWAVTHLHDSLRDVIVDLVTQIFGGRAKGA